MEVGKECLAAGAVDKAAFFHLHHLVAARPDSSIHFSNETSVLKWGTIECLLLHLSFLVTRTSLHAAWFPDASI